MILISIFKCHCVIFINVTNNIEGNEEKVINNLIDAIHLTNEIQNKI